MSDEPESRRYPREVWADFASRAALCGFLAGVMWFTVGLLYLRPADDEQSWVFLPAVGVIVALALTLFAVVISSRYRHLGLAVVGSSLLFTGLGVMAVTGVINGFSVGLAAGGYALGFLAVVRRTLVLPPPTAGEAEAVAQARRFQLRYTAAFALLASASNLPPTVCAFIQLTSAAYPPAVAAIAFWYLFVLSTVLCVWCWLRFDRPFVELCCEAVGRVAYKSKSTGPGMKGFPPLGPCLVIANHAFWFDPCVVSVSFPRPVTAIMTEGFFKVWFMKPLLKYVFRVIVVPETPLKRETPELEQAVAALDRGEVVVIFPEGYLRRKEEVPLRRFGQGVWHILHARPETPVVACWVEGGWGSLFSHKNGPPLKNKPMDFRRPINVGVSLAERVPAEVLSDQMATRIHLMNRVSAMRAVLGLEPLPVFEKPAAAGNAESPTGMGSPD